LQFLLMGQRVGMMIVLLVNFKKQPDTIVCALERLAPLREKREKVLCLNQEGIVKTKVREANRVNQGA
jgi:hypothetical protein